MNSEPRKLPGGLLIIFEGLDGAGKSTQIELAAEQLRNSGWTVKLSRNLGGTPIGEALRQVMLSDIERPPEADLYMSAAIQVALVLDIKKARDNGEIILLDRGPLSLAAYQIYGSGVSDELAWPHVAGGLSKLAPELTLFYQGDPAAMLARAKRQSDADYFESKPIDYFEKVAQGYQESIKRSELFVTVIDAAQPVEAVAATSQAAIEQVLEKKLKQL